jgi:5'-3' exonuclease
MGIPTFFLSIIKNKKYSKVHSKVENGKLNCDYFFLDYNGIVYNAYDNIKKDIEGKNLSKNDIEKLVIDEVVRYTQHLICTVVQPKKLTYISFDGPAPRAKMVQQRSRRYKGYADKMYLLDQKKHKFHIDHDEAEWDRSPNISPGTEFMQKLGERLTTAIKGKQFNLHNPKMQTILSDSNVPGEGEHKFLSILRTIRDKTETKNLKIYLYGKDADLIVLSICTHKENVFILREVQKEIKELKEIYADYEFLQINVDNLKNIFYGNLTYKLKDMVFNRENILNDYMVITFLVGNDFVMSLPFLKIRKGGLDTLISIYHTIKKNRSDYLTYLNEEKYPELNFSFFKDLIYELSLREDDFMKEQQLEINKLMEGYKNKQTIEYEKDKTPFEIFSSRYSHLQVCSSHHPLFQKYNEEFKKINYNLDYDVWSEQYYKYYLTIDKSNLEEYNNKKMDLVKNYMESIVFTLKYYFNKCPSWTWHYKNRISPLLSDVYHALDKNIVTMDTIKFEVGTPYTPFQQLALILPPQMSSLLPEVIRPIMKEDRLLCTQFYPIQFNLDVTVGIKTIYSEAILPEIDEELLITTVQKYEKELTGSEKERNTVSLQPKKFVPK